MTGYVYQLPEPDPAIALDHLDKYCGRYQSLGEIFDISLEQGGLVARTTLLTVNAPEQKLYLKPINEHCFAVYTEHGDRQHTISFLNSNEQGQPDYLFSYYARLCPRML